MNSSVHPGEAIPQSHRKNHSSRIFRQQKGQKRKPDSASIETPDIFSKTMRPPLDTRSLTARSTAYCIFS